MVNVSARSTTCYRPNANGTITGIYASYFTPSTGSSYSPCCFSSAAYIEDNVCYQADHTEGTGYYMALCTDPTYTDPSCPKACSSYTKGDIVYVNNQWLCCGADSKGSPACSNPTTEVVNGIPNPNTLQAVLAGVTVSSSSSAASATSIRTSTQSISSSSSTSTVGPSSNSSSSSSNQAATTSSGLSTGAKAGIGAGVGILVIIAFLAAFFLLRRSNSRRHQRDHPFQSDEKVNDSTTAPHKYHSEMDSAVLPVYHERDTKLQQSYPAELMSPPPQSQQRVHEMG